MLNTARNMRILLAAAALAVIALAQLLHVYGSGRLAGADDPWTAGEIVEPDALARSLSGATKPVVFQVGIVHLFRLGHIPGSKYAGPCSNPEGLEMLKKAAQDVPRTTEIVHYCGCCPWKDCPNIRPAHKILKEMGFKTVKVLNIPTNFSEDWAAKGLPTEKAGA